MTKKSAETFTALCDAVSQSLPYETAAKTIGIGAATLWRWIKESREGRPEYVFDYQGERMALHDAMKQCSSISYVAILQSAEHRARYGVYVQAHYKGRPQWQEDPALMPFSDEELERLGLDRWLRDERGQLVPVLIWEPPPVQLIQTVLAARFPKLYGHKQQIEVTKSGGVSVIKHEHSYARPPEPVVAKPVEVIAPPPEIVVEEPEVEEIAPEADDGADRYWTRQLDQIAPEAEEPVPMPPSGPNPAVKRDSPLRRELEALAAARAAAPPPPLRPPPPVNRSPSVERDTDCGPGNPRPGGTKIA
jgi:hypothetical protein